MQVLGIKTDLIKVGDDLVEALQRGMAQAGIELQDGDILVVSESTVATSEGRVVNLEEVTPGILAKTLAANGNSWTPMPGSAMRPWPTGSGLGTGRPCGASGRRCARRSASGPNAKTSWSFSGGRSREPGWRSEKTRRSRPNRPS